MKMLVDILDNLLTFSAFPPRPTSVPRRVYRFWEADRETLRRGNGESVISNCASVDLSASGSCFHCQANKPGVAAAALLEGSVRIVLLALVDGVDMCNCLLIRRSCNCCRMRVIDPDQHLEVPAEACKACLIALENNPELLTMELG